MNDLVSIIIPVFNGGNYVANSIESALSQTYSDIEVIVVNDGSQDDSLEIAQRIQDIRLIIVNQPNGGVTAARMAGLSKATGKWICFLDADDTLPPGAIKEYSKQFVHSPDIIISGTKDTLTREDYLCGLLKLTIRPELWGKIFKAETLKNNIPHLGRDIVMGEDLIQNLVVGMHAEKTNSISALQYNINLSNLSSITKTFHRSFEYESKYFELMDTLFLDKCRALPFYKPVESAVFRSKINGLKRVVLDGNRFDTSSAMWKKIEGFYSVRDNKKTLGLSERLLLMLCSHQKTYRTIMRSYLSVRK